MTAVVDTRDVIARFQAGDRAAYADLYTAYRGPVFGYVYCRVAHRELAEDLTQDVFVKALRSLNRWQDRGADPAAWLLTIARNAIASHCRRHEVRRTSSVFFLGEFDGELGNAVIDASAEGDPEMAAIDHGRDLAVLTAVVSCLGTGAQREVILNRFMREMTIAETAQAMGRTEPAVKTLQYRALRSMGHHFDGRAWL